MATANMRAPIGANGNLSQVFVLVGPLASRIAAALPQSAVLEQHQASGGAPNQSSAKILITNDHHHHHYQQQQQHLHNHLHNQTNLPETAISGVAIGGQQAAATGSSRGILQNLSQLAANSLSLHHQATQHLAGLSRAQNDANLSHFNRDQRMLLVTNETGPQQPITSLSAIQQHEQHSYSSSSNQLDLHDYENTNQIDYLATTTTTTTTAAVAAASNSIIEAHSLASILAKLSGWELLLVVLLISLILISIVGNCLVCIAIFTDRRLRKLGNAFIVSLAIADLFVSCLVMTFALCNDLMDYWMFGEWFCDIWISFDIMCCTASILNLCAISLDRFIHIKDCLLYNQLMTRRVALSAVIGIWIISALVSFVPINLGWHKPNHFKSAPFTTATNIQTTLLIGDHHQAAKFNSNHQLHHHENMQQFEKERRSPSMADEFERQRRQHDGLAQTAHVRSRRQTLCSYGQGNCDELRNSEMRRRQQHFSSSGSDLIAQLETTTSTSSASRMATDQRPRLDGDIDGDRNFVNKDFVPQAKLRKLRPLETTTSTRIGPGKWTTTAHWTQVDSIGQEMAAATTAALNYNSLGKLANSVERKQSHDDDQVELNTRDEEEEEDERLSKKWPANKRHRRRRQANRYEDDEDEGEEGEGEGEKASASASASAAQNESRHRHNHSNNHQGEGERSGPKGNEGASSSSSSSSSSTSAHLPQCMLTLTPTYAIISSTISFYIPCLIMLGLYSKLFACARRHVRNIRAITRAPHPIGAASGVGGPFANTANATATATATAAAAFGPAARSGSGTSAATTTVAPTTNALAATACEQSNNLATRTSSSLKSCESRNETQTSESADVTWKARTWLKFGVGRHSRSSTRAKLESAGGGGGSVSLAEARETELGSKPTSAPFQLQSGATSGALQDVCRAPGANSISLAVNCQNRPTTAEAVASNLQEQTSCSMLLTGRNSLITTSGNAANDKTIDQTASKEPLTCQQQQQIGAGEAEPLLLASQQTGKSDESEKVKNLNQSGNATNDSLVDAAAAAAASLQTNQAAARERKFVTNFNATTIKLNLTPSFQQQHQHQASSRETAALLASQLQQQQHKQQQTSQLATHKAAITLGIIMGTFLFCWVPFFCLNIIKAFYVDSIPGSMFRAFTWLGYANSALNPIIYGIHNSEFRNAFNRIFFKHLTLKNGRQYLNRRFSYDLRPHNHHHHHHHHQQHQNQNNNNNNNHLHHHQQQQQQNHTTAASQQAQQAHSHSHHQQEQTAAAAALVPISNHYNQQQIPMATSGCQGEQMQMSAAQMGGGGGQQMSATSHHVE